MSSAAVLLRRRGIELGDGLYLERSDPREGKFEDFLRGVVAKFPRPNLVGGRLRRFVAAVNSREEAIRALPDAELPVRFRAACRDMRARYPSQLRVYERSQFRERGIVALAPRP